MTPRQLAAYEFLAGRRRERDLAQLLGCLAIGQSGDAEAINKQVERWEGDQ